MHLIDKIIRISGAKFHCNIHVLTTVHDIQDYASLIFWHTLYMIVDITTLTSGNSLQVLCLSTQDLRE